MATSTTRGAIRTQVVYDRALQRVIGHRLGAGSRYERIVPQGGRTPSQVLGLDLAIEKGSLRFFHGAAELYDSTSLIERLSGLVGDLEARADEAAARANDEAARAEEAAARAAGAEARAEEAATRATGADARASQAIEALRAATAQLLRGRGILVSDTAQERLNRCDDSLLLGRWLGRALTANDADEAFADD